MRQKLSDVRGRGSVLYREWFFHNPISHLRECDGDRCEFWRFRFPGRREAALKGFIEQCMMRFPPKTPGPLIISSFGSGLLFQGSGWLGRSAPCRDSIASLAVAPETSGEGASSTHA